MNSETQMHGKKFDHPWPPRAYKQRGDKGRVTRRTLAAMFAEWKKVSPGISGPEGLTERELRLYWANAAMGTKHGPGIESWSDLKEGQARFLLKKMREESGDGPAYRAQVIAKLARELFGAAWDRLLADRLAARFRVHALEELSPRQAHEFMEELLSRTARRDGCEIEDVRERTKSANRK